MVVKMADCMGLEPMTPGVTGRCANQTALTILNWGEDPVH